MATTSAMPRSRRRFGLGLTLALALSLSGAGCTSFKHPVSNSGGGVFAWAASNPYDEPAGIGTWFEKKSLADTLTPEDIAKRTARDDKARQDLEVAKRLYVEQSYTAAESKFKLIHKAKKLPV